MSIHGITPSSMGMSASEESPASYARLISNDIQPIFQAVHNNQTPNPSDISKLQADIKAFGIYIKRIHQDPTKNSPAAYQALLAKAFCPPCNVAFTEQTLNRMASLSQLFTGGAIISSSHDRMITIYAVSFGLDYDIYCNTPFKDPFDPGQAYCDARHRVAVDLQDIIKSGGWMLDIDPDLPNTMAKVQITVPSDTQESPVLTLPGDTTPTDSMNDDEAKTFFNSAINTILHAAGIL